MPRVNKCSYCKEVGHNYKTCKHPSICRACIEICDYYDLHELRGNLNTDLFDYLLKRFLNKYSKTLLKIICVHFVPNFMNSNRFLKKDYIEMITANCLVDLVDNVEVDYLGSTNNLNGGVVEGQDGWAIDRTPDYTLFHIQPTNLNSHFGAHFGSKTYNFTATLEVCNDDLDTDVDASFDCGICYETVSCKDAINYNCGHQFCPDCVKSVVTHSNNNFTCAFCRAPITHLNTKSDTIFKSVLRGFV